MRNMKKDNKNRNRDLFCSQNLILKRKVVKEVVVVKTINLEFD